MGKYLFGLPPGCACTCTHYRLSPAELTDFDAIFNFKNRMILVLTATVACVLSAPVQVHAEKPEAKQEEITPPLELYDTDEDGYVSAEEAAARKCLPELLKVSMLTGMGG